MIDFIHKMSDNFASKVLIGLSLRKTGQSNENILKETSHLFLNDRKIEKIVNINGKLEANEVQI